MSFAALFLIAGLIISFNFVVCLALLASYFLYKNKNKFIRNEFVLRSRLDKFDRIKFEQPKAGPQGVTPGWVE